MVRKQKPVKSSKKVLPKKKPAAKTTIKPQIKRRRTSPSKGILMTIVAFGIFASLFVMFAMHRQIKQTDLLGTYTYLSQEADTSSPEKVAVVNENGEKIFIVKGTESKKILGIIPVEIHKTIEISAETGKITEETLPLMDKLLNVISM
jgi:hypothetical protein